MGFVTNDIFDDTINEDRTSGDKASKNRRSLGNHESTGKFAIYVIIHKLKKKYQEEKSA